MPAMARNPIQRSFHDGEAAGKEIAEGRFGAHFGAMQHSPRPPMDPRTKRLLEGEIGPTLLRLAAPNVLLTSVQAAIGLIEVYFVAKLGTDALAGMSLVFPVLMLIQMMSAGAMGGGISSAVARALGSGRRDTANLMIW